jgi:hypothetical protein
MQQKAVIGKPVRISIFQQLHGIRAAAHESSCSRAKECGGPENVQTSSVAERRLKFDCKKEGRFSRRYATHLCSVICPWAEAHGGGIYPAGPPTLQIRAGKSQSRVTNHPADESPRSVRSRGHEPKQKVSSARILSSTTLCGDEPSPPPVR